MAVAADFSNWVRELDEYQTGDDGQVDERLEASESGKTGRPALSSRAGSGTSRKLKPRGASAATTTPLSQAEELQQEMKLLNWHKLANEAALKAAIIKTNKVKQEDSQFASALTQDERQERAQREQQIIEEEQLKPLQVNSEFFRTLEAKGQQDEAKLDDDVQRHIQHLRKLKESMAQREDMQRRRQQYREKMLALQAGGNGTSRGKTAPKSQSNSNQDEEKARGNSSSVYYRAAMAAGGQSAQDNASVMCSLDKLMELEQRIRHLEDAGLAVDDLEDARNDNNVAGKRSAASATASGLRFAKRRANGGLNEPSRTVYAVTGPSKMRARDKPTASTSSRRAMGSTAATAAKKRTLGSNNSSSGARARTRGAKTDTFLTSLPESKQRQMRRMTDRERRNFLKNEKASETRAAARKQDVVIEDWLEKKRAAATQRKAATSQVRAGARSTTTASGRNPKQQLPPPPRVRAPVAGAASGKRIANAQLQKLDDLKKGFTKRKEALQRLPPPSSRTGKPTSRSSSVGGRNQRSFTRSAVIGASTRQVSGGAQRSGGSTVLPPTQAIVPTRALASRLPTGQRMGLGSGPTGQQVASKLPVIQRNTPSSAAVERSSRPAAVLGGATLPRLTPQTRAGAMPSPPAAVRSANLPTFSRLHKR
ncbi:hypothetical protein BBJ28_00006203 [Nothophytophthora sp. Chile5]|nr:hypothetical protein BBJ28_00006203 [Nothophytophthora sp. Chile5]